MRVGVSEKYYFILAGRYEITSIFIDAILEYIKVLTIKNIHKDKNICIY